MKKQSYVIGKETSEMFEVVEGKICKVIRDFFYNGESWYKLEDEEGNKFESPTVFWREYTDK